MNLNKQQKNKEYIVKKRNSNSGFTIVEALVAVFLLSVSVSSMLGVNAASSSTAKYANNEITANYLLQEAIDSIRNSRDTIAFQKINGGTWESFLNQYGYNTLTEERTKCFSTDGCTISVQNFDPSLGDQGLNIVGCNTECPSFKYDDSGEDSGGTLQPFYYYAEEGEISNFKRTIKMDIDIGNNPDEITIIARVDWFNGESAKFQTLESYLLNWQK